MTDRTPWTGRAFRAVCRRGIVSGGRASFFTGNRQAHNVLTHRVVMFKLSRSYRPGHDRRDSLVDIIRGNFLRPEHLLKA